MYPRTRLNPGAVGTDLVNNLSARIRIPRYRRLTRNRCIGLRKDIIRRHQLHQAITRRTGLSQDRPLQRLMRLPLHMHRTTIVLPLGIIRNALNTQVQGLCHLYNHFIAVINLDLLPRPRGKQDPQTELTPMGCIADGTLILTIRHHLPPLIPYLTAKTRVAIRHNPMSAVPSMTRPYMPRRPMVHHINSQRCLIVRPHRPPTHPRMVFRATLIHGHSWDRFQQTHAASWMNIESQVYSSSSRIFPYAQRVSVQPTWCCV